MTDAEREHLERQVAIETVHGSVIYVRALMLMLQGVYMSAPWGSETEKNARSAYQFAMEALTWLEPRAAVLPPDPRLPSKTPAEKAPTADDAATGAAPERLH